MLCAIQELLYYYYYYYGEDNPLCTLRTRGIYYQNISFNDLSQNSTNIFYFDKLTSQYSVIIQKNSPSRKLSWNLTMLGWCSLDNSLASCIASTVSSGARSPHEISFKTFLEFKTLQNEWGQVRLYTMCIIFTFTTCVAQQIVSFLLLLQYSDGCLL